MLVTTHGWVNIQFSNAGYATIRGQISSNGGLDVWTQTNCGAMSYHCNVTAKIGFTIHDVLHPLVGPDGSQYIQVYFATGSGSFTKNSFQPGQPIRLEKFQWDECPAETCSSIHPPW